MKHVDASPTYFRMGIAERIAEQYPLEQRKHLRFIVTLCDPTQRLEDVFAYYKTLRVRGEPIEELYTSSYNTYADWLRAVLYEFPLESKAGGVLAGGGTPSQRQKGLFDELQQSTYDEVLREYTNFFNPNQFLVLPAAYYEHDREGAVREVAAFVGAKATQMADTSRTKEVDGTTVHATNATTDPVVMGEVTAEMRNATSALLRPHMTGLRYLHCAGREGGGGWGTGEGIKLGAWSGDAEARKKYWNFMPGEALRDC